MNTQAEKKYNKWIVILSIAIPAVVALLFGVKLKTLGFDVKPLTFLPPIYAAINGLTAVLLIAALVAVKQKDQITRKFDENGNRLLCGVSGNVRGLSHDFRSNPLWWRRSYEIPLFLHPDLTHHSLDRRDPFRAAYIRARDHQ